METGRSSSSQHDVGRWLSDFRQKADAAEGPDQRLPCWGRLSWVARMSIRDRGGWRYKNLPVRPSIRTTPGFTCRARLNDWPPTKEGGHTSAPCLVQALVSQHLVVPSSRSKHLLVHATAVNLALDNFHAPRSGSLSRERAPRLYFGRGSGRRLRRCSSEYEPNAR
jgi:hypothetical protein